MKRRDFLRKAGLAAAATVAAPYILPGGRLFAATGTRLANHVVFCLFAGGVRNLEAVQKADGNLMNYSLNGTEPVSSDILPGIDNMPGNPLAQPLQNFGTLYKEFRYVNGPAGHYSAHTVAVTGRYVNTSINLNLPPEYPTVFELYRKHSSPAKSALNAWWVSNTLGPYPALHFSSYPGYGAAYGANFIAPTNLISTRGYNVLGDMKEFTTAQETKVSEIREFLDKNFSGQYSPASAGISNDALEFPQVRTFVKDMLANAAGGQYDNPWMIPTYMNNDQHNVMFAEEIIKEFQPELLVVNMQDVDVCHFDFTQYANNLRRADFALAHLWDTIQSTPGMANDTVLIAVPEHGRNLTPNTVMDAYGRFAIDHTAIDASGEQTSREIFCLVAGPPGVVNQGNVVNSVKGESIDVVATIARVLGFDTDIPNSVALPGQFLQDAFV